MNSANLERNFQREFDLTHTGGGTRRSVSFDVGDLAGIAAAIDTEVTLIRVEAQYRVIEHVKHIHAELRFHAFGDGEIFEGGRIGKKCTRSTVAVHANVSKAANPGISKRSAGICGDIRDRIKELDVRVRPGRMLERSRSRMERPRSNARTANIHVFFFSAIVEARSPRQSATPVRGSGNLPSSDDQVFDTTCTSGKRLPFADRQLVDKIRYPYMSSNLLIRPVSDRVADREIVGVVCVRFCKRVVRHKLQAVREAVIDFNLQRVVNAVRIVAQEVALIRGAAGQADRSTEHCVKPALLRRNRTIRVGERIEVRPPLRLRQGGIPNDRRLIHVVGVARTGKYVGALVPDIRNF